MNKRMALSGACLLVAVAASAALAIDAPIPGKVAVVKPANLTKFVAKNKPIAPAVFPLPVGGSGDDPTLAGATLDFFDTGFGGAGSASFPLDATGWKALGSPPGSAGYKYKGKDDGPDPDPKGTCKVVLIKDKTIKAVCKGVSVTLTPPFAGNDAVQLTTGTLRYCAEFGGTTSKNDIKLFKRKDAPAPGGCAVPPGAPTSTPTATPSGTPTNTPTSTVTNTPANTPTSTPTSTPTNTPTDTPIPPPTNTPTITPTRTPTRTPTNTPTSTPTNTPASACPMAPGVYTLTGQPGGTLITGTAAPFPFPAGGIIAQEVAAGNASCVHSTVVPFPGGFSSPVFCVPGVLFSVKVVQTGCGIGRIDSNGGSDFTILETADTSDASPTCSLPHPAGCMQGSNKGIRNDVKVGNGVVDTCSGGATVNAVTSIPVFTTVWIEFSSGFSCPSNDGTFDPGDSLVTQFTQTLDFTTDNTTAKWMDLDGDGCFLAGQGPAAGYSGTGTCINLGTGATTTVAAGNAGSGASPFFDLTFINTIPNIMSGPTALTGATCPSPPLINFSGTVNRCIP